MNKPKGILALEQLRKMAAQGEIETVVVGFTDHYGRLLGKRFDAEMFVEEISRDGAHACDYLLTVDMEMDPVPGYRFASWLEKSALVLCDVKNEKTHEQVSVAPRSILRRQVDAAKKLGYACFAATELEHYLFRTPYRDAARREFQI